MPVSSPPPSFNACILQPALRTPDESPLQSSESVIQLMSEALTTKDTTKIDLFVLPELCPVGYSEDTFANYLPSTPENKKIFQQIDKQMGDAAKELDCAICYGTIGWNSNQQYFIRQVVIDNTGKQIASYDKIHLCNYGDCAETRFFTPGTKDVSFAFRGWKFGVMICADIRYPILSQRLVKNHSVDVLLQPACFMRDISFRTWQSFRETRAVENGSYFLSGNYAGDNYGEAAMIPPWVDEDHEPIILDNQVGYLVAPLHKEAINYARTELPFHKHLCSTNCCDFS